MEHGLLQHDSINGSSRLIYLDAVALAFIVVALIWAFFFAGQSRRFSPAILTFLSVDALNLALQLLHHALPEAGLRSAMLVMAVAMIASSLWLGIDAWKNGVLKS